LKRSLRKNLHQQEYRKCYIGWDSHLHAQHTRSQELIKKISEFEANFQITKDKVNNSTVILFEDESYIRDYQAICATWFLKGQQRKVKTYGQHKGVGLFGFLDYQNGKVLCDVAEQLNAQNFQLFLENSVFPAYEDKNIIMILDNSKIHHAKLLEPFKEKYKDKIEFLFLPPYAPTINRIEGLWKWLKQTVICNRFLHTVDDIRNAVFEFLEYIIAI
jgi:transposase